MRKHNIVPLILSAVLLFGGCAVNLKNEQPTEEILSYIEAPGSAASDENFASPTMKIEADSSVGNNMIPDLFDPATLPVGALENILPSVKKGFTLPEVVKGPLATKDSNGVSKYLASLSVSTNKIIINQSTGRKLKTDTSKLASLIKNYAYETSVLAIRISDGSYIAYNIDKEYACASTIKAPYSMYVYSLAADKQITLGEKIKYQSYHYISGTGIIKNSAIGTPYTVRDLVRYSMIDSDNIAHTMLVDRFGKGINQWLKESGSRISFASTDWPMINARDAALWWNEIYEFKDTGAVGKEFFNIALEVRSPILYEAFGTRDVNFAHKSGWVRGFCHEAGIVMTQDPYILVVLTTKPVNSADTYTNHIVNVIREVDKIMNNK